MYYAPLTSSKITLIQYASTYISEVAESHIESVINARHKSNGKMQWTREGAHNVLQIRAIITDKEWESRWQEPYYPPSVQLHEHAKAYKYITLPHASFTQNLLIFEPFLIFA